jgi:hypothetical protein
MSANSTSLKHRSTCPMFGTQPASRGGGHASRVLTLGSVLASSKAIKQPGATGIARAVEACSLRSVRPATAFNSANDTRPCTNWSMPHSRAAPRSPRNRRGPPLHPIDHDHKSGADRSLVRLHRQSHDRRCHSRSPRPQRLSHRAVRREPPQKQKPSTRHANHLSNKEDASNHPLRPDETTPRVAAITSESRPTSRRNE